MKRTAGVLMLLATVAGCVSTHGSYVASGPGGGPPRASGCSAGGCRPPVTVPGVMGPWGQPVSMAAPYTAAPPSGTQAAYKMLGQSLPLEAVQQTSFRGPGVAGPAIGISPPGVPAVPSVPGMTPGAGMMPPPPGMTPPGGPGGMSLGMMPPGGPGMGPGGPGGPGGLPMGVPYPPGAVAAIGALTGHNGPAGMHPQRTEIYFTGPLSMRISWYAPHAGGKGGFSPDYIEAPGRYNFLQAAIYRLKLTDIPNRAGMELYPTLEVVPANQKTSAFLAHSAVPVTFTEEDFEQVASGNYVVKVIYLPDPQYQDLATTGPDELVSSRLEPGVDPIVEACKRGSILAVVRMGNILLELPNSPAMDAPGPMMPKIGPPIMPPPGMAPPGVPIGPPPGGRPGMSGMPPVLPPSASPTLPAGGPVMLPPAAIPSGPQSKSTPPSSGKPVESTIQPAKFSPTGSTPTPASLAGQLTPPPPMPTGARR